MHRTLACWPAWSFYSNPELYLGSTEEPRWALELKPHVEYSGCLQSRNVAVKSIAGGPRLASDSQPLSQCPWDATNAVKFTYNSSAADDLGQGQFKC